MKKITINRITLVKESTHLYDIPKRISTPDDAIKTFNEVLHLDESAQEIFACIFLDTKNHVVGVQEISRGSVNACVIHPREVFKAALLYNATGVILGHNHPSGDATPSKEDCLVTKRLVEAGKLMDTPVLDHLVIGGKECYLSFKEHNMMEE